MTEESNFSVNSAGNDKNEVFGEIEVAPEVIEVISGIAASKVEGVYAMQGRLASGVAELFGRVNHKKGVHLITEEDLLKVEVYCYLNYGVSVPKVALEIQQAVRDQLVLMTDIHLTEVNVHIVGIIPEKKDLQKLLNLDDNEDGEEG